jgi:hypothetical protein
VLPSSGELLVQEARSREPFKLVPEGRVAVLSHHVLVCTQPLSGGNAEGDRLIERGRMPVPSDGLVFTATKGGEIRRPAFYRLVWKPALEAAGLQGFPFGHLRHTGATMMLEAGANPSSSRSGSATPRREWWSSTMPDDSIAPTRRSRLLWTLRHVCGTLRVSTGPRASSTPPDLRLYS